jgi:hypothetical protein
VICFAYIGVLSPLLDTRCEIGHVPYNSKFLADFIEKLNLEIPKRLSLNENRPEGIKIR